MTKIKNFLLLALLVSVLTLPFACKKKTNDPEPEPDTTEIIVADITKPMDLETRAAITAIDTSDYTFTFGGETNLLSGIQVGDILVDSGSNLARYGYLRKVISIETSKGETKVFTTQAGLTEAILQGSIDFNSGKLKTSQIERMELADGVKLKSLKNTDFTVFDMDYDMEFGSGNDKITVEGSTALDIEVFFKFDWDYCILCVPPDVFVTLFESGVELNQSASINITSQYGASIKERIPFATYYFEPWTFSVGPVPVVFIPKIELFIAVDGTLTAEFSAGASESFNGRLGAKYTDENSWEMIKEKTFSYDYFPPVMDISAHVEANVGPEVSLMLYGIAGPYTNVTACTKLDADIHTGTNNWDLDYKVGVKAAAGIKVDVLFFEDKWGDSICLFEQTLMHLDNEPMDVGVFFETPVDGNWYSLGSQVALSARVTGPTPSSIEFFVDGELITSLTQEPWEYEWSTQSASHGEHALVVNELIGGSIVSSDTIVISLLNAEWEIQDLSSLNQNNETYNHDVFFSSSDQGWMCGGTGYGFGGYMLHTNDGGASWQKISPTGVDAPITLKKLLLLNESEVLARTMADKVITSSGWDDIVYPVEGGFRNTFENFEVKDMAINNSGKLKVVGNYYNVESYVIQTVNAVPFEYYTEGDVNIPYYYDDNPTAPKIYYRNAKGIVYNLKDQGNPLRQYIMLNDGTGWESLQLNASGITRDDNVYDAFFLDEEKGWLVGKESQGFAFVLITTDGGSTWEKINVENASNFRSIWMLSTEEGYATVDVIENNPKLYHTQDGGQTWAPIELTTSLLAMKKVFFRGPYLGYAVGQGSDVYRFSVTK
jgi:photosystem II stability/assembly factor-like uncharacterized protein